MSMKLAFIKPLCLGAVLLCSACSRSESDPLQTEPKALAAEVMCTVLGGDKAVASFEIAENCVNCTVQNAEKAADGRLDSDATLHSSAALSQGVSLRVTRPDRTFAGGRPIGAVVRETRLGSAASNPYLRLRTYLAGALQEELVAGVASGINVFAAGTQARLLEAQATKDFDALELSVGGSAMAGEFSMEIVEMCSEVAPAPEDNTAPERFFAPAGEGASWTLQHPGRYATSEMRDWFAVLENAADAGAAVALPVSSFAGTAVGPYFAPSDQIMNVALTRSRMLDEDTFFQINTVDHTGPFVRVYEGHVVDRADSLVHLTLADDFLRGVVRIGNDLYLVRIGMLGNLPVALRDGGDPTYVRRQPQSGDPVGCPADPIPNNNQDVPGVNGGHRLLPPYLSPQFILARGEAPELEARIILDADLDAYRDWGRHLPAMMIAMHVEQSVTYRHQVGVRLRIAGVHLNTIEGYYPEPFDTPATFDYMEAWWGGYMADRRDIVHLLTGKLIDTYMASCIGAAGTPYGYFYTSTDSEYEVASFHGINVMSHEIGHLFGAHHHYANHVEYPGSATLMLQGYTPGDIPVFSSLSRGVIRGWAEQYLPEAD